MSSSTISTTVTSEIRPAEDQYIFGVSITNTGAVITSSSPALYEPEQGRFGSAYRASIVNDGKIITTAGTYAASLLGLATLTNFGTISGGGGVLISIGGTIDNTGSITGTAQYGVKAIDLSLSNSGEIGGFLTGVGIRTYGSLENSGHIYGGITGASLSNQVAIDNSGSIGGAIDGIIIARASYALSPGYSSSITNAGTISGGVDAIYDKFDGSFDLTVDPGAVFTGAVVDLADKGELVLAGTTAAALNVSSFAGLTGIEFAPGAQWVLQGSASELATGQTMTGFWPGNTIILDSFAATSESLVAGIGLELSNGSVTETLAVNRPLPGSSFSLTSDGTNSTIAVEGASSGLISIISTTYTTQITPGSGNYSDFITITNTGIITTSSAPALDSPSGTYAVVVNHGQIFTAPYSVYSYAVHLYDAATFINDGTVTGSDGIYEYHGTVINYGTVTGLSQGGTGVAGDTGAGVALSGVVENAGNISGNDGIALFHTTYAGASTLINTGNIAGRVYGVLAGDTTIVNAGTISGGKNAIVDNGGSLALTVDPGAAFIGGVANHGITGDLTLAGTSAGSLDMGSSFTGFGLIDFGAGTTWTLEGGSVALAADQIITGFTIGDTIVLDSFAATGKIYAGGEELVLLGSTDVTLDIIGNFSTSSFLVTDNAQGGTDIAVLCYLRGTKLLAPEGERAVEDLRIGDALVTRFGGAQKIKWIGRQNYSPVFAGRHKTPVRITAGALGGEKPRRDLFVSPGHSVLLGEQLILARNLVNGITVHQAPEAQNSKAPAGAEIEYFLIEFETHDCVLAEGLWAESFADGPGLRAQFHNAAAFYALYPDYVTPDTLALCAPRPQSGPALATALGPVVARARAALTPGPLRGFIDILTPDCVEGWAQDEAHPELPVALHIFDGTVLLGTILACDYREDLAKAGIGSGHCHFKFLLRQPVQNFIRVVRASDGAEIFATNDCARAA